MPRPRRNAKAEAEHCSSILFINTVHADSRNDWSDTSEIIVAHETHWPHQGAPWASGSDIFSSSSSSSPPSSLVSRSLSRSCSSPWLCFLECKVRRQKKWAMTGGIGGKHGGEGDLRLSASSTTDPTTATPVGNDQQQRKKREQGRSPVEERERREADGGSGQKRSRGQRRWPAMAVVRRERVVGWSAAMGNADKATAAVLVKKNKEEGRRGGGGGNGCSDVTEGRKKKIERGNGGGRRRVPWLSIVTQRSEDEQKKEGKKKKLATRITAIA